jgi:DNA-binding CsgD family transcriptional regulator/transcriptional regulator with XRE-family HTH domain
MNREPTRPGLRRSQTPGPASTHGLAQSLSQRRRQLGLTLPDAAKLIGISPNDLVQIERGASFPSADVLGRLKQILNLGERLTDEESADALRRVSAPWPLVGRQQELAAIASTMAPGRGSAIVLAGDEGVGKTRLAQEALAMASSRRYATVSAVGLQSATSIPFGAFAAVVSLPSQAARSRQTLLRAATAALVAVGGDRRVLLAVDDAHLLDPVSATFVHHVASTGSAFVIATIRNRERVPDPVLALWKDGLAQRLEVAPFDQPTTTELLTAVLGGYIETTTQQHLWDACKGHVLMLHELVLEGVETGAFSVEAGIWRWAGRPTPGVRLGEVIQARLGKLTRAEREVVELLAIGEPLDLRVLDRLVPEVPLIRLESRGLIRVQHEDRDRHHVRLAHPTYGDAMRQQSPIRARSLKRRLATELEALGSLRADDALRVVTWRLDAGAEVSVALLMEGARRAESLLDHALTERLATAAIEVEDGFEPRLLLGQALAGQLQSEEAEAVLAKLEGSARTGDQRVRLAVVRATNLMWGLVRPTDAEAVLRAAEECVADPASRAEIAALRAYFLVWSGRGDAALALAQDVLTRSAVDDRAYVQALLAAAASWLNNGQFTQVLRAAEKGIEAARRLGDEMPLAEAQLVGARWWALVGTGEIAAAGALAESEFTRALDSRLYDAAAYLVVPYAYSALAQGLVRTATRRFSEAQQLLRDHDTVGDLRLATAMLSQAAALAGDLALARAALADAEAPARPTARVILSEVFLRLGRAWIAAAEGDVAKAREHVHDAVGLAQLAKAVALEMTVLHDLVRLGEPSPAAGRLAELAGQVDGPLVDALARHAQALLDGDARGVENLVDSFEGMGTGLLAAEAAMNAARLNQEQGRAVRARLFRHRAQSLLSRCEGAWTVAVATIAAAEGHPLTPREREIAMLAAQGLASRQIAERLALSTRTVDNHLARVYEKLGIDGRQDLRNLVRSTAAGS